MNCPQLMIRMESSPCGTSCSACTVLVMSRGEGRGEPSTTDTRGASMPSQRRDALNALATIQQEY